MREIANGLHNGSKAFESDFVEQYRKQNGDRKAKDNAVNAEGKRIDNKAGTIGGLKENLKMFKAYPFASSKALIGIKILKGYQIAPHGRIAEHDVVDDSRQ